MALIHCDFFSQSLKLSCSMCVILPERRRTGVVARHGWPTLWLLHGMSDDHTIWQRRTSIERYVDSLQLAVVMPAVNKSCYVDMVAGLKWGTFVAEELPAMCRNMFPLSARRADNYAAGLSMGGYGAFLLALGHPDRYAAAASLSGALDMAARFSEKTMTAELGYIFGSPQKLRGSRNDLFRLAREVARAGNQPRLFQCCGTEDFLYQDNLRFRDHAAKLGLEITYQDGPGAHNWEYWDANIKTVLNWLNLKKH